MQKAISPKSSNVRWNFVWKLGKLSFWLVLFFHYHTSPQSSSILKQEISTESIWSTFSNNSTKRCWCAREFISENLCDQAWQNRLRFWTPTLGFLRMLTEMYCLYETKCRMVWCCARSRRKFTLRIARSGGHKISLVALFHTRTCFVLPFCWKRSSSLVCESPKTSRFWRNVIELGRIRGPSVAEAMMIFFVVACHSMQMLCEIAQQTGMLFLHCV